MIQPELITAMSIGLNVIFGFITVMKNRSELPLEREETANNSVEAFKQVFLAMAADRADSSRVQQLIIEEQQNLTSATRELANVVKEIADKVDFNSLEIDKRMNKIDNNLGRIKEQLDNCAKKYGKGVDDE